MREKDDSARGKILEAAKAEFMEKGFADASLRTIAERAGVTTGMLYSRFADKDEMFRELVEGPADELYNYFMTVQNEFAGYSPEYQRREMHPYVAQKIDRMVDLIYDNFDAFKLILCKSGGTSYEYYVDKMIDVETESTFRFIDAVKGAGYEIADIRKDLAHMLASAMLDVEDYNFNTRKRQITHQNTYFNERFGRSDFEDLNKDNVGSAVAYIVKYIEKSGEKLVYSGRLPQFFLSDVMDEDIVCPFGMEDKKLLLYDDFGCWDEGCYMGTVSKDVIRQMPKSN